MAKHIDLLTLAVDSTRLSVPQLARKYNVTQRRIQQIRKTPEYSRAAAEASRLAFDQALDLASSAAVDAVQTLIDTMTDETAAAGCRSQAAVQLLNITAKLIEQRDIVARLDALEDAAGWGGG